MKRIAVVAVAAAALVAVCAAGVPAARAEGAAAAAPVGAVVAVTGTVQVGKDGQWKPATAKLELFEGQVLKTGEQSTVEVLFGKDTAAKLGEKSEIAVADLLLKATLEKAKARVAAPGDAQKAEMQVAPVTGVRGTEQTEEKAGEMKREHYWNESTTPAK
jgi:hypothetical protein